MAAQLNTREAVAHVRFAGRSFDIPLSPLDLGAMSADGQIKRGVARYLEELAGTYHRFYDSCRVLPRGDEEATPVTSARLWVCAATATVLRNGLDVLGVTAPERM